LKKNNVWTYSNGIVKGAYLELFLDADIQKIKTIKKISSNDRIVGWGHKANTRKAKQLALQLGVAYLHLEDGFIGYLGHPTDNSKRLSLIQDQTGVYYDATQPNDLESLCLSAKQWFTPELEIRAENLRDQITTFGISKYNHQRENLPAWLAEQDDHSVILVVDQTAGDMSVECGLGSTQAFAQMIADALANHPEQLILVNSP
jgi:capsular polysaccharide export protein